MSNVCYAFVEKIDGACIRPEQKGSIEIMSLEHSVEIPVDPRDSSPTGPRRHGALKLIANVDMATPEMMKCVCKAKIIPGVEIKFYRSDNDGNEVNYYTIAMKDVRVTKVMHWVPNVYDSNFASYKDMVTYELQYGEINWLYTENNITFTDNWNG